MNDLTPQDIGRLDPTDPEHLAGLMIALEQPEWHLAFARMADPACEDDPGVQEAFRSVVCSDRYPGIVRSFCCTELLTPQLVDLEVINIRTVAPDFMPGITQLVRDIAGGCDEMEVAAAFIAMADQLEDCTDAHLVQLREWIIFNTPSAEEGC